MIALRSFELKRAHDAELAFASAQVEAIKLKKNSRCSWSTSNLQARNQVRCMLAADSRGPNPLVVLALTAIIGAVLVAWLYVGRNIVVALACSAPVCAALPMAI